MSGFDLVSRVFGILLGLATAEVLKGFARVWRIRQGAETLETPMRIGWLVPLLGILIVLDQITFWFKFAELGPHLPVDMFGLSGMIAVIGAYYGLSTFVFPPEMKQWPDFDEYYFQVRTVVIGGLLAINFMVLGYQIGLMAVGVELPDDPSSSSIPAGIEVFGVTALFALLFTRSVRANMVLLIIANVATLASDLPF
ncbi:hypothetical protein ABLE91_08350 [Aquabacter sp. CN5-332]|uniref:hypothetical protein n=1 Tax=Aquabacter sp. CN5-332 TaxID=3156608 RepID=UPI0032B3D889